MSFEQLFAYSPFLNDHVLFQQLTIFLVYVLLAKTADLFIDRIVRRVLTSSRISFDEQVINILHRPICWTICLLGLLHVLVLRPLPEPFQSVLPAAIKSFILLLWLIASIRIFNHFVKNTLSKVIARGQIGRDLFLLLKNIIRVALIAAGMLWLLAIWEVNLTPLFASAGIVGIAVALAAKDTLANFFGGISIFVDNTFKVGDFIIIDNLQRGEVMEIGIRSTRIKTRDDVLITIPNSIIVNSKVLNQSAPIPSFRIRIPVGVSYGSDLDLVETTLLEVLSANQEAVPDPPPRIRFRAFGDSSINLEVLLWIEDPSRKGMTTHHLIKDIHQAFRARGISIPFPQRDLHIRSLPEGKELSSVGYQGSVMPKN